MKLLSAGSILRIRPMQIFVSSSDEIIRRRKAAAAWVRVQNSGGPTGFVAATRRDDAALIPVSSVRREIHCRLSAKNDHTRRTRLQFEENAAG
jgi:hypothetical protein